MFQNAWSSKSDFIPEKSSLPSNFIKRSDIKYVRTIYWDEHCLECSAPACYSTCPLYIERADGACRRFEYGLKVHTPLNESLWRVSLKYRKWAKIEARINEGSLPVDSIHAVDASDNRQAVFFKYLSKIAGYGFSRRNDGLRRKKYADIKSSSRFVSDFLFQCYYDGAKDFTLFLEITDKSNIVIFKHGINIKNGFNQELIKFEFPLPAGGLVRLFPENNLNVELEIYAADFVELQDSIPKTPAKKVKCVSWDLDNTVWSGILAEADPNDLNLRKDVLETIKSLDERGIIQIIVSKNDKEAVLPVLKRLGIDHYFIYVLANWSPKSENIFYASRMLNIGLDTLCLIDDSDFERSEVNTSLPCIRVYDENILGQLLALPEFDIPVTTDGAKRRISYQQEASRKQIKNTFSGNNTEFIRDCQINVRVAPISTPEQQKRSLELLLRTNQLNLSAHRYSESEFSRMLSEHSSRSIALWVNDKFGDYGQVAFIHYLVEDDKILISEYAMSCRVAAKLIENSLFNWFKNKYRKNIQVIGVKTMRNSTLVDALTKVGFKPVSDSEGQINLCLSLSSVIPDCDCVNIK